MGRREKPSMSWDNAPPTARQAALHVLSGRASHGLTARDRLDRLVGDGRLPRGECALAYELVMGVLRHRLTLSHVLGRCVTGGWRSVEARLRPVLLLGAYQLIFLDGVPGFAAVSESVELAKRAAGQRGGAFVNALLRNLQRDIAHHRIDAAEADATRAIPIDPHRCCQFRDPVLPDPESHPVDHLGLATSHPGPLVARWMRAFGPVRCRQMCLASLARPPVVLRPNRLRIDAEGLAKRLRSEGMNAVPDTDGRAVDVHQVSSLAESAAYREGLFQPQDRTAMAVVEAMQPRPGQVVLDLCAGLGTKTTQIAEQMRNEGVVWACDKEAWRLEGMQKNADRLGLTCIRHVELDRLEEVMTQLKGIDWILVDAPCSNTGVLARRPEARYRVTRDSLKHLQAIQLELLARAARWARTGTRLAYSTCSLEPEENELVAALFSRHQAHWQCTETSRIFPSGDDRPGCWHDGGYWAVWVRV